jgi:hypothetical protein
MAITSLLIMKLRDCKSMTTTVLLVFGLKIALTVMNYSHSDLHFAIIAGVAIELYNLAAVKHLHAHFFSETY